MFKFDWQARNEDFVKWMFVHLIADQRKVDNFDELSNATKGFTNVEITMQVNGVEVNAQNFIESVEEAYKQHAERAAKQMVDDAIPDLWDLREAVDDAQHALTRKLREAMRENGVEWYDD